MKNIIIIFSLILIIVGVHSKISVIQPKELKQWWSTQDIHFSIANFGYVPWGRTILGTIVVADPIDACSPLDNLKHDWYLDGIPIILARRGNCTFVTKANNVQLSGGKMLLIVDKVEEDVNFTVLVGDGQHLNINIPTIMISKIVGDKILSYIDTTSDIPPDNKKVTISVAFSLPQTGNDVNYEIWISSADMTSFDFIREMKPYHEKISDHADMVPHYAVWECPFCQLEGYDSYQYPNCLCKGRYCATDPDGVGPLTGADIILEDLRQICIFKKYTPDHWWNYIGAFPDDCFTHEIEKCSSNAMIAADIDDPQTIYDCVNESFIGGNGDIKKADDNTLLRQEVDAFMQRGIIVWPAVVINNATYRGDLLPAKHVFEAICEAFDELPEPCSSYFETEGNPLAVLPIKKNKSAIYMTAIFIIILVSLFLFICYRRILKKQLNREIQLQLNATVSQYFALNDHGEPSEKDTKRLVEARYPQTREK